jgi:hypothetical protein
VLPLLLLRDGSSCCRCCCCVMALTFLSPQVPSLLANGDYKVHAEASDATGYFRPLTSLSAFAPRFVFDFIMRVKQHHVCRRF